MSGTAGGRPAIEMLGTKFGRLLVLRRGPGRAHGGGQARWVCACDCGRIVDIPGARLRTGSTKSCGCFRRDRAGQVFKSHGKSKTASYCMFYDARKRAMALGIPFDIEPTDIVIPEFCPVLGIRLLAKGPRDFRASLDRKIPANGYTRENICVISFRANRIKSDATPTELAAVLKYSVGQCAT